MRIMIRTVSELTKIVYNITGRGQNLQSFERNGLETKNKSTNMYLEDALYMSTAIIHVQGRQTYIPAKKYMRRAFLYIFFKIYIYFSIVLSYILYLLTELEETY